MIHSLPLTDKKRYQQAISSVTHLSVAAAFGMSLVGGPEPMVFLSVKGSTVCIQYNDKHE